MTPMVTVVLVVPLLIKVVDGDDVVEVVLEAGAASGRLRRRRVPKMTAGAALASSQMTMARSIKRRRDVERLLRSALDACRMAS